MKDAFPGRRRKPDKHESRESPKTERREQMAEMRRPVLKLKKRGK